MAAEQPWYAAFPAAKITAPSLDRAELLSWFENGQQPGKDFVLVDLRRTDHEVGLDIYLYIYIYIYVYLPRYMDGLY